MSISYDESGRPYHEEKGCLSYKDKDGNLYYMYPVTQKDCIEGLEDFDAHLVNVKNPHKVTAEQIGAVTAEYIATTDEVLAFLNTTGGAEEDAGTEDEVVEENPSV